MIDRLILIDGLPGAGKSTLAKSIGDEFQALVWYETDPEHPLHPIPTDEIGAAWPDIHERISAESFAEISLSRWRSAIDRFEGNIVFESFPFQSAIRVLFQINAAPALIADYWNEWQAVVTRCSPHLVFLRTIDSSQLIDDVAEVRGSAWMSYLSVAVEQMPWCTSRHASGWSAVQAFLSAYNATVESLVSEAKIPLTIDFAQTKDYRLRTERVLRDLKVHQEFSP